MAVEAFLPMDLLMDACILLSVQLMLGGLHARRLVLALCALCAYTLCAYRFGTCLGWLRRWP